MATTDDKSDACTVCGSTDLALAQAALRQKPPTTKIVIFGRLWLSIAYLVFGLLILLIVTHSAKYGFEFIVQLGLVCVLIPIILAGHILTNWNREP